MRYIIVFWAFIALGSARTATADRFDATGATCVPAESAVNNNRYLVTGGTVKHRTGNNDIITLYCGIPTDISSPSHLNLTYSSTENDVGQTTYVTAQYIKLHKSTGTVNVVSQANSYDQTAGGSTVRVRAVTFTDTFDSSAYFYYVRVDLRRRSSNPAQDVVFYNVSVY